MVSHSRRNSRKAHFAAPSAEKRKLMSSALSKELRGEHGVSIILDEERKKDQSE